VTLGLGLDGPPPLPARARVEAALARVGLEALADRRCDALSGGEWQRAALARATVASPALLLLDEPTNHLDPAHRAALLARLAEVAEEAAVVVATHDLELAAACDRVVLLGAGRVTALGAPDEVLTPERLAGALGVRVRRVPDPEGARPLLRVVGPA
jgi:iron complex transport system ATP-binding protein